MKIKIIEPAEIELDDAFNYYKNELQGLGLKFIDEFQRGIERISHHPEAWCLVKDNVRKYILNKFPYSIIYAKENNMIFVLAIAHHHRIPDYWIDRLN